MLVLCNRPQLCSQIWAVYLPVSKNENQDSSRVLSLFLAVQAHRWWSGTDSWTGAFNYQVHERDPVLLHEAGGQGEFVLRLLQQQKWQHSLSNELHLGKMTVVSVAQSSFSGFISSILGWAACSVTVSCLPLKARLARPWRPNLGESFSMS